MIDLKLNWFFPDEDPAEEEAAAEETETVDVPNTPGIGGVLTAWVETLEDESVLLRATFKEVSDALASGWIVAVFDGKGTMTYVSSATESDGTYTVLLASGDSYTSEDPNAQMVQAESDGGDEVGA